MIVCDLCGKEIAPKAVKPKIDLYTEYAYGAWQQAELDICDDCRKEVSEILRRAEAELYQRKRKEVISNAK